MGTLELRITAVKPGVDGKLVRVVSLKMKLIFGIFSHKNDTEKFVFIF